MLMIILRSERRINEDSFFFVLFFSCSFSSSLLFFTLPSLSFVYLSTADAVCLTEAWEAVQVASSL